MENMRQEIKSVEQALLARGWDGDLRKCQFDTDWQGRKNKNYKIVFHLKQEERQVDLFASIEYCQKRDDGGLCYSVESKLMDGCNSGKFVEFERALKFFLTQVASGFDDLKVPEEPKQKKSRGRKRQTEVLEDNKKAA